MVFQGVAISHVILQNIVIFFCYTECPYFLTPRQLMLIIAFMIFKRSPIDSVNTFIQILRRQTPCSLSN
jgi:hypothetical protein